jgi:membrane associated rhomboid family serine protease
MTFDEKLAAAKQLLASKGIPRAIYAPSVVALLWRLGVRIRPPHFVGFFGNFVFSGGVFGIAWGVFMWFLVWSRRGVPLSMAAGYAALVGLVGGFLAAGYYRYAARKYSIPAWRDFVPVVGQPNRL